MTVAYLGLGSNLASPQAKLRQAVTSLLFLSDTVILRVSSFYRSKPWGGIEQQPDFVNAVVAIATALTPTQLLTELKGIERVHGRRCAAVRWGPRELDIDILLYGGLVCVSDDLTIPHPHMQKRDFVIHPLLEIAPRLVLPNGIAVSVLAENCSQGQLCLLEAAG